MSEIDIRRKDGVTLVCPQCHARRELPPNWEELLRPTARSDWDGKLRCQNGHEPTVMISVTEVLDELIVATLDFFYGDDWGPDLFAKCEPLLRERFTPILSRVGHV